MVRHALAPLIPPFADSLGLPRTLTTAGGDSGASARVALTFDDGPHPEGTPRMLEILARAGARATFFVVGEQVQRRPALARRILQEGHGLALHGHRHRLQLRLTARELQDDLERGLGAIEDAAGVQASHHRPPYGIYSASGLRAVRTRSLQPLLWSAWGRDWRAHTTPERIATRVIRDLMPDVVVLLHDADFYGAAGSHERTALALPLILRVLSEREIGTVPVV